MGRETRQSGTRGDKEREEDDVMNEDKHPRMEAKIKGGETRFRQSKARIRTCLQKLLHVLPRVYKVRVLLEGEGFVCIPRP